MSKEFLQEALKYASLGIPVFPCLPGRKAPSNENGFKGATVDPDKIRKWWSESPKAGIGVATGERSGLVILDIDPGKNGQGSLDWYIAKHGPLPETVTSKTGGGGLHYLFHYPGYFVPSSQNKVAPGIDIRADRGYAVMPPSRHPGGGTYQWLHTLDDVALADTPQWLLDRIREADDRQNANRSQIGNSDDESSATNTNSASLAHYDNTKPIPADQVHQRAIAYIENSPGAISEKDGYKMTFWLATVLIHGFLLDSNVALQLLTQYHNPRCEPPWSDKELLHKVNSSIECPPDKTPGWLLESSHEQQYAGVDISGIADKQPSGSKSQIQGLEAKADMKCRPDELGNKILTDTENPSPIVIAKEIPDSFESQEPGIVPMELLRVPGFISEVMDFCMSTAPYPNQVLAFCGAIALQAFLAARKVRDPGDNRTNLYLLGLAHSSAGKDWPRKLNTRIIYESGLADGLGEKFASGEGLQDSLYLTPSMLFQTDEIDGMLQAIRQSKEARYEMLMGTLMTLYTSSSSIYPLRRKANEDVGRSIDQPSLTIFGTAIPTHYYEALSHKMLSNGFFGRMFVVEAGPRGKGQEPTICALPPRVLETAQWWADYGPAVGHLSHEHPEPTIIEQNAQAKRQLIETRLQADGEYSKAESQGDPVGTTVWGRVNEQARKLSLIYAISENPKTPCITLPAAQWASQLVMHQASRMLFQANLHVADNPFHAECLNVIQRLREMPDYRVSHSVLLKRMKMKAKDFKELMDTMAQRGDIVIDRTPSSGRPHVDYVLAPR